MCYGRGKREGQVLTAAVWKAGAAGAPLCSSVFPSFSAMGVISANRANAWRKGEPQFQDITANTLIEKHTW